MTIGSITKMLFAAIPIMFSAAVSAQNAMVLDRIKALDAQAPQPSRDAITAALAKTAESIAEAKGQCKPTAIEIVEVTPITGARVVLQGIMQNQLKNGWSVYARRGGCPGSDVTRYAVLQLADGSLLAPQINEGRSFANLSVMRDTSAGAAVSALQALQKLQPDCKGADMAMGPTRIVSQEPGLGPDMFGVRYTGSWTEAWSFTVCGRTAEVQIKFTADGDGGAYTDIKAGALTILPVKERSRP